MGKLGKQPIVGKGSWALAVLMVFAWGLISSQAGAFTVTVVDHQGNQIASGFRWLLEEDNTNHTLPGVAVANSISLDIHKSHAPVVLKGSSTGPSATVAIPDPSKRYFLSILPDTNYSLSGISIAKNQTAGKVIVHQYPIPTAQISVLVFKDHNPINNVFDAAEAPPVGSTEMGGWQIIVFDQLGQITLDGLGNPLQGYDFAGQAIGAPGYPITGSDGRVFIKDLAPGKYGVRAVPPGGQSTAWIQTATIEGTPGVDAWVMANEPPYFVEGFGTAFTHVFLGFVKPTDLPGFPAGGTSTVSGTNLYNHFARPSAGPVGFAVGPPVAECWVGINDPITQRGLAAKACNPDSTFSFDSVPAGTYQLVTWDRPLDALFGIHTITVPAGGSPINLGKVMSFRWFGTLEGTVFYDKNQNGFRETGEPGISNQVINLRFRDGSMYQTTVTDNSGEYGLTEVFPFFKWLVAEVDYTRYKATGMTTAVDYGGTIPPANGWITPSFDVLNPQPQATVNPHTGNNQSRTERGPVLLQAMQLYLNQTNVIDWGKVDYGTINPMAPSKKRTNALRPDERTRKTKLSATVEENGGISGIVYYAVTRAENDPRLAAADPWEPGIPRVQVNLYEDFNSDGVPDGPAVDTVTTDSWDDSPPTGCIQDTIIVNGQPAKKCYDNYSTWNQVRPGVFDGGYAFGPDLPKGTYIVEVVPPAGYEIVKEEDKNVDFGDEYAAHIAEVGALSPVCVGPDHLVPPYLTLFPNQQIEAPYAGEQRPLCNRKQILVEPGKNAAVDFHLFTEVPKAARTVGFVNNDLAAEFNSASPIFGEKAAPSWLPISFQDWRGNEITRVYTDEWGSYNALLPSTFSVNVPIPTGVSPNVMHVCLNYPLKDDPVNPGQKILDPFFNPDYSQSCWAFDFWPGKTTYLDTPIVPIAAFVVNPVVGLGQLDVEPPTSAPVIHSVSGPSGGPWVSGAGQWLTIYSLGQVSVPNPAYNPTVQGSTPTILRNYGFGDTPGTVTLGGTALTNVIWTDHSITGRIQNGNGQHQLVVARSNGLATEVGVTVHVGGTNPIVVNPGQSIQTALDGANPGELILISPGSYSENVIMWQPVRLQGWGAGSTTLNASPFPRGRLDTWRQKIRSLYNLAPEAPDPFFAKEGPGVMVLGDTTNPAPPPPGYGVGLSRIDGFTITGSLAGGGVYVNSQVQNLQITNNKIKGNQGIYGGGITVGTPAQPTDPQNDNITIRNNYIVKNGSLEGAGGIAIYTGADNYQVRNNNVSGNLSRFHGGGLGHYGVSNNGLIQNNQITFNETFFGGVVGGEGGGLYISGEAAAVGLTPGAGNLTVNANLIQGNLAGAGKGGGIRVVGFNGADADPATLPATYRLNIYNNMIVNNVAAFGGGGIALQDLANGEIINNTIANNDSTSTAASAFPPNSLTVSAPEGAGIVSGIHSAGLAALIDPDFSNPTLVNNIIRQNRSWYWDAAQNGGNGGLVADPGHTGGYWDLQVFGITGQMNPTNCLLTDITGYPGNLTGNPSFLTPFTNNLLTAIVLDEGGNSISVRYTPNRNTNYHIGGGSAAINQGDPAVLTGRPLLATDYDGQIRPGAWDIGADEAL